VEFGDLRQACHARPGPLAFARAQAALGRLFAADPLGALDRALPYARAQLDRWPDRARWLELGDATSPDVLPRDPRQLGLARVLVFSSARGALDRAGHSHPSHLAHALEVGATGPLELLRLELDVPGNDALLRALCASRVVARLDEVVLVGTRPGPLLASLAATRFARVVRRITLYGVTRDGFSRHDQLTMSHLERVFPALEHVDVRERPPPTAASTPFVGRVTLEDARAMAARALEGDAGRIMLPRWACEERARAWLRDSEVPYVCLT
jgi:hypothetical protein